MPRAKAPNCRPKPLVRRLSAVFPTEVFGRITAVLDVTDYGGGTPCTSAHAFLELSDGTPFYDGAVALLNGGIIIESNKKKNGRPAKTNRDVAVCLAMAYFATQAKRRDPACNLQQKGLRESVRSLWEARQIKATPEDADVFKALKRQGEDELKKTKPLGQLFYTTHDGLDGAFVHMQEGGRLEPISGNEVVGYGPCWLWRYGDEEAAFYGSGCEAFRFPLADDANMEKFACQVKHMPSAVDCASPARPTSE